MQAPSASGSWTLTWQESHDGSPRRLGYRGDRLVGSVAFYDVVGGGGPGWVGYVHWDRVTGRCRSADVAMRLVDERAPAASPPRAQ